VRRDPKLIQRAEAQCGPERRLQSHRQEDLSIVYSNEGAERVPKGRGSDIVPPSEHRPPQPPRQQGEDPQEEGAASRWAPPDRFRAAEDREPDP